MLRVRKNFRITLPSGTVTPSAQAAKTVLKHKRLWEIRSAGKGSKGDRWYAWAWIATASPRAPEHTTHWVNWRRTHQARSRWFHKRTRLARNIEKTQVN